MRTEDSDLIDTGTAPEFFAQGLAKIEDIGNGCVCFVFFRNVAVNHDTTERHVVLKIIAPLSGMEGAADLLIAAFAEPATTSPRSRRKLTN